MAVSPNDAGRAVRTALATKMGQQYAGRIDAIVIGTSAGGVEALMHLLPALPPTLYAAVMIVMHLPRGQPSLLVNIFAPRCSVPICEALDKEPVMPGTVYFCPPDYHLLVDEGPQLSLSIDEPVNYHAPAIDVLFDSAADVYGERLLGIVLTGANEDGAAGLARIHRAKGAAIVQQPDEASAALMPESAIRRVPEAVVLTLEQIAAFLGALGHGHATDSRHARK